MTDTELIEALAAKLRAYATAPLASLEVHEWEQAGLENTTGSVVVDIDQGSQSHIALGDDPESMEDAIALSITGIVPHADSQANRRNVVTLREQIVAVLRQNRALTAGGENATTNAREPIGWSYLLAAEGERSKRACVVTVTYRKTPDAAS